MPPKKNKNKKKNSLIPKENGDADPLVPSVPETPADEKEEFATPADRLDNPLDVPDANGLITEPASATDEKDNEKMAKAEGDEVADAWGLGDEKSKVITEEPEGLDATEKTEDPLAEIPEDFQPRDLDAERAQAEKEATDTTDAVVPPVVTAEEAVAEKAPEEPAVETTDDLKPAETVEEKVTQPVDLDIPDTADAKEPVAELEPEKVEQLEATPEVKADEPEVVKETVEEPVADVEAAAAPTTEDVAPVDPAGEDIVHEAEAPPVWPGRALMEEPKPATLVSLTSSDRDFTSKRYQSTTSPEFLNRPHQAANHSLDLDDRNMQSSVNNWYKKIFAFSDGLKWRPGWEYSEEYVFLVKALEAPLSQISLPAAQDWWADKPQDPTVEWDKIDELSVKYEEFWEWKSKIALSAICANFACREILGKSVFGLDDKMTRKLGGAMMVFATDFGDDITATKFRHMTLKLLQESRAFQSATRKKLIKLSQELANVLSPLTSFLTVPEPRSEEEKIQQQHYTPLVLALYEKVLLATLTLHDTLQKDHKYFALFHPVPGVEFDESTMEEATFEGHGAGKGSVALVARPGLARLGLPRGGEPEDIIIVHKALVVRDDALEEAAKFFDEPPAATEAPPAE